MAIELKNRMKTLTKDLFDRIDEVETQLSHLKRGMQELLEEEDLRSLPSYGLLHSVYTLYLTEDAPKTTSLSGTHTDQAYDPLYAPPKARKHMARAHTTFEPRVSDTIPDLNTSLLEPTKAKTPVKIKAKLNTAASTSVATKSPTSVATKSPDQILVVNAGTDIVYKVEVQGKVYLRHAQYLYDIDSNIRVGSITEDGFSINGQVTPITASVCLKPVDKQYFSCDSTLYVKVTDSLCQAVGEYNDGEIGLWG